MALSYADIVKGTASVPTSDNDKPTAPSNSSSSPKAPVKGQSIAGAPPKVSDIGDEVLRKWSEEQMYLAKGVIIDDQALGFCFHRKSSAPIADTQCTPSESKQKKKGTVSAATCSDLPIPAIPADASPCVEKAKVTSSECVGAVPLTVVAGVDISFVKDTDLAVASLAILSFPSLEVIHTAMHHVRMTEPYIPGYLAFREVPLVQPLLEEVKKMSPEIYPQMVFVDGNGIHHPRRCGFASHLGVLCDIPTIGCAKNLLAVDGLGKNEAQQNLTQWYEKDKKGPIMPLVSPNSKLFWGYAAFTGNSTKNPIFVSPGHRVSFETAMALVLAVTLFRVPEPIRQADLLSRKYIKEKFNIDQ